MQIAGLIAVGLVAGILSGMFGIGGGLVIVPGLMYLAGLDIKAATGTSLTALVLPTGLLGAMEYYRAGLVDTRAALLIFAGIFVGAFFGAKWVIGVQPDTARKLYAVYLLIMGVKLFVSAK